ncbi:MAG: hypothetical protein ACK2UU_14635 [Anaerolineae bacterium]|jgi:hypothetical protein
MRSGDQGLAQGQPGAYEISVRGSIADNWSDWFEGMTIEHGASPEGIPISTLSGTVVDQAALIGILRKLHNLRLELLSVNQVE